MNQEFISQTLLDQMISTDRDQLLKAAIPYLPPKGQQILSIYEKSMELFHTLSVFGNPGKNAELSAMSLPSKDPMEMLNDIRSFCYGASKERLDQIVNMMAMLQMLQLMNQPSVNEPYAPDEPEEMSHKIFDNKEDSYE